MRQSRACASPFIRCKRFFAAIYIKFDPGNRDTGFVENITYRNIYANNTLIWPIWIEPQQQRQPGTVNIAFSELRIY